MATRIIATPPVNKQTIKGDPSPSRYYRVTVEP